MATFLLATQALFLWIVYISSTYVTAQSPPPPALHTPYVTYLARSPHLLNLGNISDLFSVSRLSVASVSNLASEDTLLLPDQLLLVPITCGCTRCFANITYQIKQGDSYYLVAVTLFENLTNWRVVEDMNPNLKQTLLHPGDEVIIPLFCKCPSNTQLEKGIRYMIPYVWQPDDDLLKVAAKLNASAVDIQNEKKHLGFHCHSWPSSDHTVSQLPFLSQFFPSPPEKGKFCHRWIIISVVSVAVFLLVFIVVALLLCTHSYKKIKALNHSGSGLDIAVPFSSKELHKSECYKPKIIKDKLLPRISGCIGQPIMYDKKYMTRSYIPVNYAEIAEIVFSLTVLTHSSSETLERSWSSAPELEEVSQIVCPASATPR